MISFLLSAASIEPKMIITIALGAVCAVIHILLIVEHSRRKKADDRAAVAALDAKLAKADAERAKAAAETARANAVGALNTVKEESHTEFEYDPRLDPSPMGVVS